jgi:hypothetical protein
LIVAQQYRQRSATLASSDTTDPIYLFDGLLDRSTKVEARLRILTREWSDEANENGSLVLPGPNQLCAIGTRAEVAA